MKKVIRCKKCELCAELENCGFIKKITYICSRTDDEVSLDDGCTFGHEGDHMIGIDPVKVNISNNAIVWGGQE